MLSLLGTYFLTLDAQHNAQFSLNLGDSLILLAATSRALMVTMIKKLIDNKSAIVKTSTDTAQSIPPLALTAVQSIVVFIGCLVLFLETNAVSGDSLSPSLPTTSDFWLPTLYLVIFCTIFAFFVQNWAIKIGSPSRASLLMGSEPVFGALFAVLLFKEQVGVLGWLGITG